MGWRENLRKRLRKDKRRGYASQAYAKGYQTRGRPRNATEAQTAPGAALDAQESPQDAQKALLLAHGHPVAEAANPSENLAEPQPVAQDTAAPVGSGGEAQPLPHVELFERPHETNADVRLARMAIKRSWEPEPRATQAILTKAAMMALRDEAKLNEVVAVAKLHLDAHGKVMVEEHHNDRMEYYDRALALRASDAGMPGTGIRMETDGKAKVTVYLPNNGRDVLDDDLRPEDLLRDDDG